VRLLTLKEVREVLRVSDATVARLVANGELPVLRPSPRCVRVEEKQLERWVLGSGRRRGVR